MLVRLSLSQKKSHHNVRRPPENVERQSKLAELTIRPKYISGIIKTLFAKF